MKGLQAEQNLWDFYDTNATLCCKLQIHLLAEWSMVTEQFWNGAFLKSWRVLCLGNGTKLVPLESIFNTGGLSGLRWRQPWLPPFGAVQDFSSVLVPCWPYFSQFLDLFICFCLPSHSVLQLPLNSRVTALGIHSCHFLVRWAAQNSRSWCNEYWVKILNSQLLSSPGEQIRLVFWLFSSQE